MKTLTSRKFFILNSIRKKIFKMISFYFSINPAFTKRYVELFPGKEKVIETVQGVNTKIFHPVSESEKRKIREKLKLPQDRYIIITVGVLLIRKGFYEAFHTIEKLKIPYLYLILGDYKASPDHYLFKYNSEMSMLHHLGNNLLKKNVLFVGSKDNVHEYLQSADVFLLNSSQEGVPNALLEAMSCGVVPVVRTLAGVSDYLTFHLKNSMEFHNENQMLKCIESIHMDTEKRENLSINARESILQNADFEITMRKLFKKMKGF